MDSFEMTKQSLKHCYRVDRYSIADIDTNEVERLAEYFIVTGDNSCIRVIDYDTAAVKISVYGNSCFSDYETYYPAEYINTLHDLIMIYDYCITELRKMPLKEAHKSELFYFKKEIDKMLVSGQIYSIGFPVDKKMELQQRCNYLAHAYELEWNGTISIGTCRNFSKIEDLDRYVEQNKLTLPENKESKDKRVFALVRNRISTDFDPLENVREIGDDLFRYKIGMAPGIKEIRAIELADAKYMKEYVRVLKMDKKVQKLNDKIPFSRSKAQLQKLVDKSQKLEDKIEKDSAHIMFLKD